MEIKANSTEAYNLMHQGVLALFRAEQQGFRIDVDYCNRKIKHLERKIERAEQKFKESDFYKDWKRALQTTPNPDSPDQLQKYLYEVKKLKPSKTTKTGKGSVDEEALTLLNIPALNFLLEGKKLKKIKDTYLGAFMREQVDGFIHPFYNLHIARTYRSSSDSPNFQNISKRDKEAMMTTRRAIYPRERHQLMEVDYGALEVRIAACYHKDPTMINYIEDPTTDMHGDMAKEIFIVPDFNKNIPQHKVLRGAAKNGFVFPEFYGSWHKNCAKDLAISWGKLPEGKWMDGQGIEVYEGVSLSTHLAEHGIKSLKDFEKHLEKIEDNFWNIRFPVYKQWKEDWYAKYQKNGYLDMYTGFRCSGLMGKNDVINYPVQGAAFHCLLWSFIEMDRIIYKEGLDTRLLGQIHDAIILDVHPDELEYVSKLVHRVTCEDLPKAFKWINVPLEVEADLAGVDESWADLKKFDLA